MPFNTARDLCPEAPGFFDIITIEADGNTKKLLRKQDNVYDVVLGEGKDVSFKLNNPFGAGTNVYLQSDQAVREDSKAWESRCGFDENTSDCSGGLAKVFTARCMAGGYAVGHAFFVTEKRAIKSTGRLSDCCEVPLDGLDPETSTVVRYSFEINCGGCPATTTTTSTATASKAVSTQELQPVRTRGVV